MLKNICIKLKEAMTMSMYSDSPDIIVLPHSLVHILAVHTALLNNLYIHGS